MVNICRACRGYGCEECDYTGEENPRKPIDQPRPNRPPDRYYANKKNDTRKMGKDYARLRG